MAELGEYLSQDFSNTFDSKETVLKTIQHAYEKDFLNVCFALDGIESTALHFSLSDELEGYSLCFNEALAH